MGQLSLPYCSVIAVGFANGHVADTFLYLLFLWLVAFYFRMADNIDIDRFCDA